MAHVALKNDYPGIGGLLTSFPETGNILLNLAETLFRGPSSLTSAERETIATMVSAGNRCKFCTMSHAAAARSHWGEDSDIVDSVLAGDYSKLDAKLSALLAIAEHVRGSVTPTPVHLVQQARDAGADDKAVHDTVLIAAAFSMYNRYVEGLATYAPEGTEAYVAMGERLAKQGYLSPRS